MTPRLLARLLGRYAKTVDGEFQVLMRYLFGDRFCPAPVKKVARMETKVQTDLDIEAPALAAVFAKPEQAQHDAAARAVFYDLGDLVRGSVVAEGAGMLQVIKLLQSDAATDGTRHFEAWRVKNSHHRDAKTVGGSPGGSGA